MRRLTRAWTAQGTEQVGIDELCCTINRSCKTVAQLRRAPAGLIAAAAEGGRYHQQLQGQDLLLANGSSSRTALTHTLAPTSWHLLGIWSGSIQSCRMRKTGTRQGATRTPLAL